MPFTYRHIDFSHQILFSFVYMYEDVIAAIKAELKKVNDKREREGVWGSSCNEALKKDIKALWPGMEWDEFDTLLENLKDQGVVIKDDGLVLFFDMNKIKAEPRPNRGREY